MNKECFKDMCLRLSNTELITEVDVITSREEAVPNKYVGPVESLIKIMRPKMDILDRISIPFIEAAFADINEVTKTLDEQNNGDIPEGIIQTLSTKLYNRPLQSLNTDEQAIIKVLSCYICIQK